MKNNIDKKIQAIKVKHLSDQESDQVWQRINAGMNEPVPTVNFLSILIHKPMIQIALVIILLFGGSVATVAAANDAKPGDLLFPLDRAIENVQIKIAPENKRDELKVKFALERAEEMEEIILESLDDVDILSTQTATGTITTSETVTTTTDSTIQIDKEKIEKVYATAFGYIEQVRQELLDSGNEQAAVAIDEVIDRLNLSLDELPNSLKVEIEKDYDDNKLKIEVKTENDEGEIKFEIEGTKSEYESEDVDGNKVKIKVEDDGKVKVEYEKKDKDDSDKKSDEDKKDDSHDTGLSEAEAKVYQDRTVIEVEFNDSKSVVDTNLSKRAEIVDFLANRFDVSIDDVDDVLKIEYKNNFDDKHSSIEQGDNEESSDMDTALVLKKVEAESSDNGTKIKIKFEDLEAEFFIEEDTREAVVNFVADKYDLDKDDVDTKLQFEL